jgi:hypothetical protein
MKKLVLALTVVALCSLSFAGSPSLQKVNPQQEGAAAAAKATAAQAAPRSPLATTQCSFGFVSGANNTSLAYCVTANGNIPSIETPLGQQLISSFTGEGYGICNESPATVYYDYGYTDSGNWDAPILLSSSTTSVKIARTTSDGVWTLTQTITQVASTSSIKIAMTIKNNTAAARVVYLVRYADVDVDGVFNNIFDATQNSAMGWLSNVTIHPFGLLLQNVGTSPFSFSEGFVQNTSNAPNPCAFAFNSTGGVAINIDGSLVMAYVTSVPAHGSKTATMSYKGL